MQEESLAPDAVEDLPLDDRRKDKVAGASARPNQVKLVSLYGD